MSLARLRKPEKIASGCFRVVPARRIPDLAEDARTGLLHPPRSLPPKYFYDDRGAQLFDRICETREYYPTRIEDFLLHRHAAEIIGATRPENVLELGSGTSRKTRRLFNACNKLGHVCRYAPFDVCEETLLVAARELQEEYPWLDVQPLLGDFHAGLDNLPALQGPSLFLFLGSSIGNFIRDDAVVFVREICEFMSGGDYFLIGIDRPKDPATLHAAYNDAQGVTAEFNLNVLRVLNRELDADFDLAAFEHQAVFNAAESRMEMYLVSKKAQEVRLGALESVIHLEDGERILTEYSHKYPGGEFEAMLTAGGMEILRQFDPPDFWYSLILARKPPSPSS